MTGVITTELPASTVLTSNVFESIRVVKEVSSCSSESDGVVVVAVANESASLALSVAFVLVLFVLVLSLLMLAEGREDEEILLGRVAAVVVEVVTVPPLIVFIVTIAPVALADPLFKSTIG
ncbi:MAG: hypothetical protein ACRD47_17535, partial [Nitrososphaeraceae archaeon]